VGAVDGSHNTAQALKLLVSLRILRLNASGPNDQILIQTLVPVQGINRPHYKTTHLPSDGESQPFPPFMDATMSAAPDSAATALEMSVASFFSGNNLTYLTLRIEVAD